jgi:AcrR family transcriptional regulator
MTVSPDSDPRANQKQRTRTAIVDAAIALLATGCRPTVSEAATAAKVSRATAYRYFPTQDSLLVEAAAHGPVEPIETLVAAQTGGDARARFAELQAAFNALVGEEEAAMRMALRSYLDAWFAARERGTLAPDVRQGRRMRWIAATLAPARGTLAPDTAQRLSAALALTLGIEPLMVMKDICRLDDAAARDTLQWMAKTLLEAALTEQSATRNDE